jgi:hypothetical protein
MRSVRALCRILVVCIPAACAAGQAADKPAGEPPAKRRGFAVATETRPARFPHRIWAACDYEARTVSFGWFGIHERKDLAPYPGNTGARRAEPFRKYPMKYVGCNPVPGPRMGAVNKMYCRYRLWGTDKAQFQHYSLSVSDNCNIRVSGLTQDKWSEVTLNFTRDSRRNDGSPGAFKKGERMDDLKVFVRDPKSGADYGMVLDDVIFFAEDPKLPPEPEPFPNRVIFLAAFDTGTFNKASTEKFFPGEFEVADKPPAGAYWVAAKAVHKAGTKSDHVLLQMKPVFKTNFHVGAETKLRFRYWLKEACPMMVILHDKTAGCGRVIDLSGLEAGKWVTRYVNFSKDARALKPKAGPLAAGNQIDSLAFEVPAGFELYVDEIVLYDAGKPRDAKAPGKGGAK